MIIAMPTGVKIFNWLFTIYRGRLRFSARFCGPSGSSSPSSSEACRA